MSYQSPAVTPAGLSIPSYADILALKLSQVKTLYGQSVYLGNDSSDYQLISLDALMVADGMSGLQQVYSNRGPSTAIGAGLDSIVGVNGIARLKASFSTVVVTITGVPGTVITNGVVKDTSLGLSWDLPSSVVIPGGGTVNVIATCEVSGAVNIPIASATIIQSTTSGWVGVTNAAASAPGNPVETDAQLRARQAISVALPSRTVLQGTIAAIAATLGVTRYNVIENFTNTTDSNGTPAHSVSAVVEGATDLAVATAIYNNRGIGPLMNGATPSTGGSTSVNITDPITGLTTAVGFYRPTNVPIFITVTAHLQNGGTSAQQTALKNALLAYLATLQIGATVNFGALVSAAMSVNPNLALPIIEVRALTFATTATPTTTTDVTMLFTQVAQAVPANVIVNLV